MAPFVLMKLLISLIFLTLLFLCPGGLHAFKDNLPERGIVRLANKFSFIHRYTSPDWKTINKETVIVAGDSLKTEDQGRLVVYLDNRVMIALKPNSVIQFLAQKEGLSQIRLFKGSAYVIVKDLKSGSFGVVTDSGTGFSSGGHFIAHTTEAQNSLFYCLDGMVESSITGNDNVKGAILPGFLRSFALNEPQLNRTIPINKNSEENDWRAYQYYFKEFKRIEDNFNFSLYKDLPVSQENNSLINFRISTLKIEDLAIEFYDRDRYLNFILPYHLSVLNRGNFKLEGKILPADPSKDFLYEINGKRVKFRVDEKGVFKFISPLPKGPHSLLFYQKNGSFLEKIGHYPLKTFDPAEEMIEIEKFFQNLAKDFERKNIFNIKPWVSTEYRDKFGGSYFSFTESIENGFRLTDDIFLQIRPQRVSYPYGKLAVHCIVVFSYIERTTRQRFTDRYLETFTLIRKGDGYQITSKERGNLFAFFSNVFDQRNGSLEGTLIDEARNTPVAGVKIEVLGTSFNGVTDSLGRYRIEGIPPGTYNVRFTHPGYAQTTVSQVRIFQSTSPTGFNLGDQITFDSGDKGIQ